MDDFTDEQILALDPEKFTIAKIKSVLSARSVELPSVKVTKEEYVRLFKEYQDTLRKGKKRKSDAGDEKRTKKTKGSDAPTTPPSEKSSKSSASTTKKRRKSSNIFQQRPSPGDDGIIVEEVPRKSRKSMPAPLPKVEFAPTPTTTPAPQLETPSIASTPQPLPFPILRETIQSTTPYNFNTPLPSSTPTQDTSSYSSTYNTPKTPAPPAANAGRTPYSLSSRNVTSREYNDTRQHRANELQQIIQQQHRGRKPDVEEEEETQTKVCAITSCIYLFMHL